MSQALLIAAKKGDLATVKTLVEDNRVNINYVGPLTGRVLMPTKNGRPITENIPLVNCSALVAAICNEHPYVVEYLLEQVDIFVGSQNEPITAINVNTNAYFAQATLPYPAYATIATKRLMDANFKKIVQLTNDLNPEINLEDFPVRLYTLLKSQLEHKYLEILLHESLFRTEYLDEIRELVSYDLEPQFNIGTLTTSLLSSDLKPEQFFESLQRLAAIKYNTGYLLRDTIPDIGHDFFTRLERKYTLVAIYGVLDTETVLHIKKPGSRTLKELVAELLYHLYPELNLPLVPVDSQTYSASHNPACTLTPDEIASYQELSFIDRFFLQDPQTILLRIFNCTDDYGHNPAIELFAYLLIHHGMSTIDERIIQTTSDNISFDPNEENDHEELASLKRRYCESKLLFSNASKSVLLNCFLTLGKMSEDQILTLYSTKKQTQHIETLDYQTQTFLAAQSSLNKVVETLTSEVSELKSQLALMTQHLHKSEARNETLATQVEYLVVLMTRFAQSASTNSVYSASLPSTPSSPPVSTPSLAVTTVSGSLFSRSRSSSPEPVTDTPDSVSEASVASEPVSLIPTKPQMRSALRHSVKRCYYET